MQQQSNTEYSDVVADVAREISTQLAAAQKAGIESWRIVIDPGIGFAKDIEVGTKLFFAVAQ